MDDNKTLKPFDKVLVRDEDDKVWTANIFSHYRAGSIVEYVCMGFTWKQCIPYEGNQHLLGTDKSPNCEREEPTFPQKVVAYNPGLSTVRGYFLKKITMEDGEIRYKVLYANCECIGHFKHCVAEEWEE